MKKCSSYLIALLLVASFIGAKATIINVPADYSTIQAALNAAASNDTVLVQPNTYSENITWPGTNAIKLISAGDSTNTIIDGGNVARVISITSSNIDTNTVIQGFTITNGNTSSNTAGPGLHCSNASVLINECKITGNRTSGQWSYGAGVALVNSRTIIRNSSIDNNLGSTAASWNYGGGIFIDNNADVLLENVIIADNYLDSCTWAYGGGVHVDDATVTMNDVWITGNRINSENYNYGAGLYLRSGATANLNRVYIIDNEMVDGCSRYYGGGIYSTGSTLNATNVLISDNLMGTGGFWYNGGGINLSSTSTGILMNVTIANNRRTTNGSVNGGSLYLSSSTSTATNCVLWNMTGGAEISGTPTVTYSDVNGGFAGAGNINSDPLFVSSSDYHLQTISPCADAGTTSGAPPVDIELVPRPLPFATNDDMGTYEVDQSSWASISNITNVLCNGDCNGTTTITATSGNTPYTYNWSSGGSTATETGLCNGIFTVTVTDNTSATITATVTITEPAPLLAGSSSNDDSGNCDGDVTVTASGGTSPYSYQWDSNTGNQSTQTATGLCVGYYCVTVTDDNGCTVVDCDTVDLNVGLTEFLAKKLTVSPNPFREGITVNYSGSEKLTVAIYDLHGRLLKAIDNAAAVTYYDLNDLPTGIYYLLVANNKETLTKKLVKLR